MFTLPFISRIKSYSPKHRTIIIAVVIIVLLGSLVASRFRHDGVAEIPKTNPRSVVLLNTEDLNQRNVIVTGHGMVESLHQAIIRSQATGQVVSVPVSLGSRVSAGQTLIQLRDDELQAQKVQSLANVSAQTAILEQLLNGAKIEDIQLSESQLATAKKALEDATKQQDILVTTALSSLLNNGLVAQANSGSALSITISGSYTDTQEGSYTIRTTQSSAGYIYEVSGLETMRQQINQGVAQPLGTRGLFITFSTSGVINSSDEWTVLIPNIKASGYAGVQNAYHYALQTRETVLNAAQNAVENAQKALDLKKSKATAEQIQTQESIVEQAKGSVAYIQAQLNKVHITSPLEGLVADLSIKVGEFISQGQTIATIVNNNGMQIKAFISAKDLSYVRIGDSVEIGELVKGVVSRVSPSIDVNTKNAQVDISISDFTHTGLTIGQDISVKILSKKITDNETDVYYIPLSAVKILPDSSSYVYTVNNENKAVEHAVTLGMVEGETVQILKGLHSDMHIIESAFEMTPGQEVIIQ